MSHEFDVAARLQHGRHLAPAAYLEPEHGEGFGLEKKLRCVTQSGRRARRSTLAVGATE